MNLQATSVVAWRLHRLAITDRLVHLWELIARHLGTLQHYLPKADITDASSSKVKRPPSEAACSERSESAMSVRFAAALNHSIDAHAGRKDGRPAGEVKAEAPNLTGTDYQ